MRLYKRSLLIGLLTDLCGQPVQRVDETERAQQVRYVHRYAPYEIMYCAYCYGRNLLFCQMPLSSSPLISCHLNGQCLHGRDNLLSVVNATSGYLDCLLLCRSSMECDWFTVDARKGVCRLLTGCNRGIAEGNRGRYVSAQAQCPITGARCVAISSTILCTNE